MTGDPEPDGTTPTGSPTAAADAGSAPAESPSSSTASAESSGTESSGTESSGTEPSAAESGDDEPAATSEPASEPDAEPEPEGAAPSEPETEPEPRADDEPAAEADADVEAQPEPEDAAPSEPEAETETEPRADDEPAAEADAEVEAEAPAEPDARPEAEADTAETSPDPEPVAEAEAGGGAPAAGEPPADDDAAIAPAAAAEVAAAEVAAAEVAAAEVADAAGATVGDETGAAAAARVEPSPVPLDPSPAVAGPTGSETTDVEESVAREWATTSVPVTAEVVASWQQTPEEPPAELRVPPVPTIVPATVPFGTGPRRRHIRQTITFLALFGIVLAMGVAGYKLYQGDWALPASWGQHKVGPPCPVASPTAAPVRGTRVNVYNGTNRRGLAQSVARELHKRGFVIPELPANDPLNATIKGAAVVRYGPDGLMQARTVAAQVIGAVTLELDDSREGSTVDLVLGAKYKTMRPVPLTTRLMAPSPAPSVEGCIPVEQPSVTPSTRATPTGSTASTKG